MAYKIEQLIVSDIKDEIDEQSGRCPTSDKTCKNIAIKKITLEERNDNNLQTSSSSYGEYALMVDELKSIISKNALSSAA
jgi:hypothetical protein